MELDIKKVMNFSNRIFLFVLGMFVCCYGIAIVTRSNLGTSPIACPNYVATFIVPLSFGVTTFIVNALCLLSQIILLGKQFPKIQFIQLPIAMLTGAFIDLSMFLTQSSIFQTENYTYRVIMTIVGSIIIGLGVALEVYPNLTYMPGEGLVKVISDKFNIDFGKVKVGFDVVFVATALLMGVIFLHRVEGVREGTIISALLVGIAAGIFLKLMNKMFKKR